MYSFIAAALSLLMLVSTSGFAVEVSQQEINEITELHLSTEELTYLETKQQITMCVDPDWMPYEKIEKGQHIGMSADFMRLFSEKINIPIILVPTKSWVESLEFGRQRKCDVFSLVIETPERRQFLDFSEPYVGFPLVIASRYEQIYITDIDSIKDKKLGVEKGYGYSELLRLEYPTINLIEVESLAAGLQQVSDNQLFGMIDGLPSVAYVLQKKHIGELKISGQLNHTMYLGVGVRNDEPLLVNIFDKAIATVNKKERTEITQRWMATQYELGTDFRALITALLVLAVTFVFFIFHYLQLKKHHRLLQHLSVTDKLTNISNRIKLDQELDFFLALAERYQKHFCLILLDLDHFKAVNDNFGHLVGDNVLQAIAKLLRENTRIVDTVGRWGGEEFMIICPDQSVKGAKSLAEKLRILIAEYPFEHKSSLSCSFGITWYQDLDTRDTLIKRADDALYKAKDQGRNCVVLAKEGT